MPIIRSSGISVDSSASETIIIGSSAQPRIILLARQPPLDAYKRKAFNPFRKYPKLLLVHYLFELINLLEVHITNLGIEAIPAEPPLAALILFLPILQ